MTSIPEIRADFIRRLFAVAVSVGFATTLVQMNWVKTGSFPMIGEWKQLAILLTGMIATVSSWDGYLASIDAKPLVGRVRYMIDISLVFIYMFFLISSSKFHLWLPILALMFILYSIWDFLTIREHIKNYDVALAPQGAANHYNAPIRDVLRVYGRALCDAPSTNRGGVITISWTVFFVALATVNIVFKLEDKVFVMSIFANAGLIQYRRDKGFLRAGGLVKGYTMATRVAIIVGVLVLAILYAHFSRGRV